MLGVPGSIPGRVVTILLLLLLVLLSNVILLKTMTPQQIVGGEGIFRIPSPKTCPRAPGVKGLNLNKCAVH